MRVYIICDLEGTAGVLDFKQQCMFNGGYYQQARRWASAELRAAVEGALAGGAREVVAWDGHCSFPGGLDIEGLPAECQLIEGAGDGGPVMLDSSFDAMFQIGLHGMAGAENGVLAHSFVPFIDMMWVNGQPIGEIGMNIHTAGVQGVPCVLISGDLAAATEAQALVPGIETAVVKRGLATPHQPCGTVPMLSHTPEAACSIIRKAAEHAMSRVKSIQPFTYESPYTVRTRYRSEVDQQRLAGHPGATLADDCTLEITLQGELEPLI